MSEMQGLASAIRLLAAAAKDKIDDELLSESPDQIRRGGSARFDRRDGRVDGAADTNGIARWLGELKAGADAIAGPI
jgi:hypothetical protein